MEKNHRYSKKQKYLLSIKIYKESKTKYKDNHSLEANNYITNKNKEIFISNNRQLYTKYIVKSINEEKRVNKISELTKIFIKKKLITLFLDQYQNPGKFNLFKKINFDLLDLCPL